MDCLFGLVGDGFTLVVADTSANQSIVIKKTDEDKIMILDETKLLATSGEAGDRVQFSELIQKNIHLYAFRNSISLSTSAAANFTRLELATALRSRGSYQTNMLLAGFDEGVGPSLYYLDYLATLHKVKHTAIGYCSYFVLSIFDKYYKDNMTLDEALEVVDRCIAEVRLRLLVSPPNFLVKIVDKDGARELLWRRTVPPPPGPETAAAGSAAAAAGGGAVETTSDADRHAPRAYARPGGSAGRRRTAAAVWGRGGGGGGGRLQDDPLLNDLAEFVLETAENIAIQVEVERKEYACDLVTEVDKECKRYITSIVNSTFPLHRIIGEETATEEDMAWQCCFSWSTFPLHRIIGEETATEEDMAWLEQGANPAAAPGGDGSAAAAAMNEWVWIVDPIDGTLNFVGEIPMCAVSLGVARQGRLEVGVVYNPFNNELFSCRRGEGAYLNGNRITIPNEPIAIGDAAIGVGFPSNPEQRQRMIEAVAAVAPHARTMRAFGSAALHMSYVAAGRLGAFFEEDLKPWDVAAAHLLVQEAGGVVTSMAGEPLKLSGGSVLATSGGQQLHSHILSLIANEKA
ncbi:unnamed protein product [Closterium sp. Naga37s-1]|nr:unnamed protein product [Closterium sp. Naga37s-1]